MDSVNNTKDVDGLDKCMEDYVKQIIQQGITTINNEHILECCNGTLVNNCTIQKGKNNLDLQYFIEFICFEVVYEFQ